MPRTSSIWRKVMVSQETGNPAEYFIPWHHSPPHLFIPGCSYIITASTLHKKMFFHEPESLYSLQEDILNSFVREGWTIEAWAIFPNHYHLITRSPIERERANKLSKIINSIHSRTARELNKSEDAAGRRIWFQYFDTCLTFEESYYARLAYVHRNAVHHGIVNLPEDYHWCSAKWFLNSASRGFVNKVLSYQSERVKIEDGF